MTTGQAEPWTVLRLLKWTTEYFQKRGADSPRLDAEVLLAEARGCSRIELYTAFDAEPSAEVREAFREMVRRRGEGTPVAYLVGHKEFYSIELRVSEATLIPRPETEHLVIEALDQAKQLRLAEPDRPLRLLDVGTGSGAIAIAIAANLPNSHVTAVDISPAALEIAKYNVERHQLEGQIELLESDLCAALDQTQPFDIICSNPPYVSEAEYAELHPWVRDFEPQQALVAGPQGTEIIERLLDEAHPLLVPGGCCLIELSPMIAAAAAELVTAHGGYEPASFIKDLAGHRRILSTKRSVKHEE